VLTKSYTPTEGNTHGYESNPFDHDAKNYFIYCDPQSATLGESPFLMLFKFPRQAPAFLGGFYSVSSYKKYQGTRKCRRLSSFVLAYLGIIFAFALITHFWCNLYFLPTHISSGFTKDK